MSGRIGLKAWETRAVMRASFATVVSMCLTTLLAGLVVGPHWILSAWAVGGVLAWAALGTDRASRDRGGAGSRLRRVLGRVCAWEVRAIAILAMVWAGFLVVREFVTMPGSLALLEGLPEGGMTKTEVIAAMKEAIGEACRQARENAEFEVALVGIFGIAGALLSGLTDWLVLGSVGARHGVSPWRLLGFGQSRQDWKAFGARERARRRRLLGGQ